jgi:hypothetical protein
MNTGESKDIVSENNTNTAKINEVAEGNNEPGQNSTGPLQTKTQEPEPVVSKTPSRFTKTVAFSPDEFAYIDAIFKARETSGITDDYNHFIRQCIDYTLNNEFNTSATGGVSFAKPPIPKFYLKNGFFNKK